jgi:uncharacterized protein
VRLCELVWSTAASRQRFWRVRNKSKNTCLGDRIELADTSLARFLGLLGKRRLPSGSGLWIVPSNGVHTFGMAFAIDVVFLDSDCRVLRVRENLRPFRLTSLDWKARSVLELPLSTIRASQTEIGDYLTLESE